VIHKLNIQENIDYYIMKNVKRPCNAAGKRIKWKEVRYVNTFLHPDVPEKCTGKFTLGTHKGIPCPKANTKPLPAPPPLKENHQNYNSESLNRYFTFIKEQNPESAWNFGEAVYAHSAPPQELVDDYLAMKCMAHTYGGESVKIKGLQDLIDSVTENTQIVGILGHGLRFKFSFTVVIEEEIKKKGKKKKKKRKHKIIYNGLRGRITLGKQEILEDVSADPQILQEFREKLTEKAPSLTDSEKEDLTLQYQKALEGSKLAKNQVLLTDPEVQEKLEELGGRISPLAVIVLYHCHNGKREGFLQQVADLVDRPVFAYTGFLGWFSVYLRIGKITVGLIDKNWEKVWKKRLINQEFNYQPEIALVKAKWKFSEVKGDWVAATPSRFDTEI